MGENPLVQPGEVWWSDREQRLEMVEVVVFPSDRHPDGHATIYTAETTDTRHFEGTKAVIKTIPTAKREDWLHDGCVLLFHLKDIENDCKEAMNN